jgi:hypothetical protein
MIIIKKGELNFLPLILDLRQVLTHLKFLAPLSQCVITLFMIFTYSKKFSQHAGHTRLTTGCQITSTKFLAFPTWELTANHQFLSVRFSCDGLGAPTTGHVQSRTHKLFTVSIWHLVISHMQLRKYPMQTGIQWEPENC